MPDASDPRYHYNKRGMKAARVGQAVIDILSKDQPYQTAGETLEAFGPDYVKEIEKAIENGLSQHLKSPFYLLVLTKKEPWAVNVLRNYFIPRQSPPHALKLAKEYKHYVKTLYFVDAERGNIGVLWSVPGWEDCKSIAKRPRQHEPELVKWISDCFSGKLDKDVYTFRDVEAAASVV
jgi:hypothetical protein